MKRVAIMQPTYLPWSGYFDLMDQVDAFVLLDTVQFEKQSWQQRNRIKFSGGLEWLTVPVKRRLEQTILETELADRRFLHKHLKGIELCYRRAPYFAKYFSEFEGVLLRGAETSSLCEMNVAIIGWLAAKLGIERALPRSSTLQARGKRGGLVAQICAELGASDYVSPPGAADYLLQELPAFAERGIEVWFQHYEAQEYPQLYPPFQPNAAVLDLLFNVGGDALEVIRRGRRPARSVAEQREQISLRSVTAQDEEMVFAWRNLPEIIRCSTDQRGVTRSEHETWFRETLAGGRREMFIVLCGDLPVGTVRFDPEGVERCVLSIYLIPGYTGRGLGVQAIRMGCGLMAKRYRTVLALIRTDNAYALSAFAKAGFREVSGEELCPQGEIAMQMELG